MNGHITCYSEVDMGTRFSVYLPAAAGPAPTENGAGAPDPVNCRGAETVLLVEDDAEVRQLIHRALSSYGYQVLEAITGQHAVELAREYKDSIHLLVTDVIMPRIGGADLAGLIKPVHPETRVLYISGYTNDAIIRHGIMTANVNFLQKPFTPAGLAVKVRHVLDAREDL
jgi:DNA-binding NtrC family response regulator